MPAHSTAASSSRLGCWWFSELLVDSSPPSSSLLEPSDESISFLGSAPFNDLRRLHFSFLSHQVQFNVHVGLQTKQQSALQQRPSGYCQFFLISSVLGDILQYELLTDPTVPWRIPPLSVQWLSNAQTVIIWYFLPGNESSIQLLFCLCPPFWLWSPEPVRWIRLNLN